MVQQIVWGIDEVQIKRKPYEIKHVTSAVSFVSLFLKEDCENL